MLKFSHQEIGIEQEDDERYFDQGPPSIFLHRQYCPFSVGENLCRLAGLGSFAVLSLDIRPGIIYATPFDFSPGRCLRLVYFD
jgi:hypothetical protein